LLDECLLFVLTDLLKMNVSFQALMASINVKVQ